MSLSQTLAALTESLASPRVVERRAAVRQAAQLLDNPACSPGCRQQIIDMLLNRLQEETYTTVRDDIQHILDNVAAGVTPAISAADRPYMIGVACQCGHVSHYDRRRICSDESILWRSRTRNPNRKSDEFYVACRNPACDHENKLTIDCGEFTP